MYNKVPTDMNFVEREKQIVDYWKEHKIFEKSIEEREGQDVFTFFDGPPTANGKPHIGHILTRVIKDIIPRYKTMKGYKVLRKAGWDTHGLPVELEVEKLLGISGKPQIEDYGVEPFIEQCKKSVWGYEDEWRRMSDRVGYWADMDAPYVTYHNSYIESVWWALKQIWDKGLIYKGYKIVPYCPRCGTALSSHEVSQGYKDVKEKSIMVRFKTKKWENTFFVAWTTTPWTLPSNSALTVNPTETYIRVKSGDEYLVLAQSLAASVIEGDYEVVETFEGKDLEGYEYEPLYTFATVKEKAWYVCCADFVTMTDGTGIVHTAPAFGEDDADVGRKYKLPFIQLVNEQGLMKEEVTPWAGMFAKDADKEVIKDLDDRGLLYKSFEFEHSYPYCWRCDTPLLYYSRNTWFIEMTKVRDMLVANNKTVNWIPESIRDGRFGNFLENVVDWGLSRERYWGTPLPIWECECGHRHMIGSIEELKSMSEDCPDDIELHKPYIDNVHLKCPECGKTMTRVSEVIDCWFDSGSMPFAQWHYPFENKEIFDANFPADFISEAVDQTRGWFYTLLAISTLLFDKSPYKNVIVLGLVLDENGIKMSKHKGNVVDPWSVLDKQGADAVRWYFYTASAPWLESRFSAKAVEEGQRKFMGTLWNTYAFYALYAELDKFDPREYAFEYDRLSVMDKWVVSKLNSVVGYVDKCLSDYKITEAARKLQEFSDELSNWYVRRCRGRYWKSDMDQDKINAYKTLEYVLITMARVSAPFTPFMAESMYQNLVTNIYENEKESVHLCDFPVVNADWIDDELEANMDVVLQMVAMGRSCRNTANIKNRQPVSQFIVMSEKKLPEEFNSIVADELNAKALNYTNNAGMFMTYSFKPQLKTVGPKYGKLVGAIGKALLDVDGNKVMDDFDAGKNLVMSVDGNEVELEKDDLLVSNAQKDGFVGEKDGNLMVVLDTTLTPELVEEGFVREIISKLQSMRKEVDFEVLDRINVGYTGNEKIAKILTDNKSQIADEVLALSISEGVNSGYTKEWKVNGEVVTFSVERNV